MTRYYALDGELLMDRQPAGDDVPVVGADAERIVDHLLHALSVYECDGFRFVDVDAGGTLADGKIMLRWSDYGTAPTNPQEHT